MPPPARRPPPQSRAGLVPNMQETRRDTSSQADGHQPDRLPDSETKQAMDLQEQPEPFATAPALGSTDLRHSTNSRMSDSLGAAPLAQFAPASLTSTLLGTGTGMETEEVHCSCNDLEVSRTYGNTQISTSRMLRKYLVYDTPWCTNNPASSIYSTVRFICGMKEFLSVA